MTRITVLLGIFGILLHTPSSWSYPGGAPPATCSSMKPEHGVDVQSGIPPYDIILDKTTVQGADTLNITLQSKSQRPIRGFLVRVRKSESDDKAYGTFKPTSKESKTVKCFDKADSGITHTDRNPKTSVNLQWEVPNDFDGDYEVVATFVEKGDVYWVKHVHPNKIRATRNVQLQANTPAPAKALGPKLLGELKTVYEGCGTSKGCFGVPKSCIENFLKSPDSATEADLCSMVLTWAKIGSKNFYQLAGKLSDTSTGYIAAGLAPEMKMAPASVVGCVPENGDVGIYRSLNIGYHNEGDENNKNGLINSGPRSVIDGHLICSFEQTKHTINKLNHEFDIDSGKFYMLLAKGDYGSSGGMSTHNEKYPSPVAVEITDNIIISASNEQVLVQLHGAFMIIAWLVCASSGMFTARYLKQTHTDIMPFNKAFWFAIHITCMFATFFFTVCGIIFILVKKRGLYSDGLTGSAQWHPILGFILTGLAILQVIIAFFRPHPNTPKRPLFNWVHWSIGNSAHIVGIACIFLADTLSLSGLKDHEFYKWIVTGFVCFHILIHLVMSLHTVWADKQMNSKVKMRAARPGPMKPSGISEEAPGTGLRTFLLVLYILGVTGCSVALIYFIAKGPDAKVTS